MRGLLLTLITLCLLHESHAQEKTASKSIYFSWGYNKEWYTKSNIHVDQPALGNDLVFHDVEAHDQIGWDKLLSSPLTVPQYNYRLGYWFNPEKQLAGEINFDHTKYIVTQGQTMHMTGTFQGRKIDSLFTSNDSSFRYKLNNGANFLLFNIVKGYDVFKLAGGKVRCQALLKAGIGPVIPHVENTILGYQNDKHFQLGGVNIGVEGTVRFHFFEYVFLEYCVKGDAASYFGLRIYKGTARHNFGTFEMIGNLGVQIPVGKKG